LRGSGPCSPLAHPSRLRNGAMGPARGLRSPGGGVPVPSYPPTATHFDDRRINNMNTARTTVSKTVGFGNVECGREAFAGSSRRDGGRVFDVVRIRFCVDESDEDADDFGCVEGGAAGVGGDSEEASGRAG